MCAAVPGCGGGTTEVTGTVTYRGKPVTSGTVAFAAPSGAAVYAEIKPDGTYEASGVPVGKLSVAVSSPDPRVATPADGGRGRGKGPPAAQPAAKAPDGWVSLPPKYATPDQSGLSVTLTSKPNKYDIPLE